MKIKVKRVNAFTDSINGGNPAGVLLDSPFLSDEQMAFITKTLKVSETAFVFPSKNADFKVRFFCPEIEIDLCGHATIAAFFTMALEGVISSEKSCVTQETNVGVLPVDIVYLGEDLNKVMMHQNKVILKDISLDISLVADALNIDPDDIDDSLPRQIVSTGIFTFPVCVKSFDILKNIKPDFQKVLDVCNKINSGSFHVFTFETLEPDSMYHARCFAPKYGINEDPVTGTANGSISGYLVKNKIVKDNKFICEQGDIINRSGRVHVEVLDEMVKVGGRAVFVEEIEVYI